MKKNVIIIAGVLLFIILLIIVVSVFSNKKDSSKDKGKTGTYPKDKFTLTYWRVNDEKATFDPIIKKYQEKHPNATINVVIKNSATYENELINAIASGKGPDIFEIHNDWLAKHIDKIEPASADYFTKSAITDNYQPAVFEDFVKDDKVYAVPYSLETFALLINQKLKESRVEAIKKANARKTDLTEIITNLKKEPATWNDLVYQTKYFTEKRGTYIVTPAIAMGTTNNIDISADILSLLMLQNKTNMVSDDLKTPEFNLAITKASGQEYYPGTAALDFYTSFAKSDKETYSWRKEMPAAINWFIQNKLMMMFAYPKTIQYILQKNPQLKIQVAKVPQVQGTDKNSYYPSYWGQTVNKASKNTYAAWDFINYVASKNGGLSMYLSNTHRPSALKEASASFAIVGVENYTAYNDQTADAHDWYKGAYPKEVDTIFNNMINSVINKNTEVQRAIDNAAAETRRYLQTSE